MLNVKDLFISRAVFVIRTNLYICQLVLYWLMFVAANLGYPTVDALQTAMT